MFLYQKRTKIKETNDNPFTTGIFHTLAAIHATDLPFLTLELAKELDIDYYLNHSGEKNISVFFEKMRDYESKLQLIALAELSNVIVVKYADKWIRLYDAFIGSHYNPIENYSMTEEEKVNSKLKTSTSGESDVYGFNSVAGVPNNASKAESITEGSKDDNNRELTRKGNIGVTTSQQMLQSEIDLRKWSFFDEMMNDVDRILTSSVY